MKKTLKIVLIIVGILLLGLILFMIFKKPKPFNELNVPITSYVSNQTDVEYLKPIIYAGLYELKIDSIYLIIKPMNKEVANAEIGDDGYDLEAFILGNEKQFMIYIKNMSRTEYIKVLTHELIHLEQYNQGKLSRVDKNTVKWDGKLYIPSEIPYMERPWESDAFNRANQLEKDIRELLFH